MFSWYKYLIVSLVFSHLGFWSGNLFLIAPFPDLCLLVPFYTFHYVAVLHSTHFVASNTFGYLLNLLNIYFHLIYILQVSKFLMLSMFIMKCLFCAFETIFASYLMVISFKRKLCTPHNGDCVDIVRSTH